MKNLLNCHSIGLHSFPVSFENGLYKRIFYAEEQHNLWKTNPLEIAIHPHHVDIKITVLEGVLRNIILKSSNALRGMKMMSFKWNSVILNGAGGFERLDDTYLEVSGSDAIHTGESVTMKACELHTVFVAKGERCVWMIEEAVPSCEYFPINYSNHDLTNWKPEGLYIETTDEVKQQYIGKYL